MTETEAKGSLRLTVGKENTAEEIEETIRVIRGIVDELRSLYRNS